MNRRSGPASPLRRNSISGPDPNSRDGVTNSHEHPCYWRGCVIGVPMSARYCERHTTIYARQKEAQAQRARERAAERRAARGR